MQDEEDFLKTLNDPTFKPVLIENMETRIFKEDERGKMYLLRNPNNSKYIKMHESFFNQLKIFNGENSTKDISNAFEREGLPLNGQEIVKLLAEKGFIKNVSPPQKKDMGDLFSFKIKLFKMTSRSMGPLEKVFSRARSLLVLRSRVLEVVYASFIVVCFSLFIYKFPQILSGYVAMYNPDTALLPLLISALIFYIVEFGHEFAHAVAYYHYGGKTSDIGIEFHFAIPFFYTSTPDATWMEVRDQIAIFMAGPMTSLAFAEMFTLLFIFEPTFRIVWAVNAFFWHISTLVTLSPIIRTDGYFALQAIARFPNLLEHGVDTLIVAFQALLRKVSLKDFREQVSQYSVHEKRILKFYVPLFPIITFILVYVFVFTALKIGFLEVLSMTPQIIAGNVHSLKPYVLWLGYVISLVFIFVGLVGMLVNIRRKSKG
jgi:hypothetical protein